MKTTQNAPQSAPVAALTAVIAEAAYQLARINPAAFAARPRIEALAALRAGIAARPGNGTPAECQAASRLAVTARTLVDKLEQAAQYYPDLLGVQLEAHGIGTRRAIILALRGYHRQAYERTRCAERRVVDGGRTPEVNAHARRGYAMLLAAGAFS